MAVVAMAAEEITGAKAVAEVELAIGSRFGQQSPKMQLLNLFFFLLQGNRGRA